MYLVIKCPQQNWLLWNGSNKNNCTKWIKEFTLDSLTKEWIEIRTEFEVKLLFTFILFWIPIWLFTNYRFNVILTFIEGMQIMYIMFAFFPSISPSFKIYFENYNYLSFSVRDIITSFQKLIDSSYSTNNIKNYSKVLNIFPEAVVFLIIFLLVVLLLMKKKHICLFKIWRKSSLFSVWLFLIIKFLSLSIILNLWTFYEAKSLFDAASIICSIILWIWITLYYYWWILNYKREWMLWKRYALF